ncbi:MAG TPA: AGE family epimerase/isomerase [Caulobacteraceae bacterium]|nr:AGE family epimerase/isomerase [Caulobacteraceae bacterium]
MGVHPIVLCGGPGSRLWPASTARKPKPFVDLLGGPSLFQRTLTRLAAIPGAHPPTIVAGVDHLAEARAQLSALGGAGVVLVEPLGRDSGPALLAAAVLIARSHPAGVALAVASDHHIPDAAAFAAAVGAAAPAAAAGQIVTFGVKPTFPATAYGYIRAGEPLAGARGVRAVGRFVEKPDLERAQALVAEGCLWNSGNFMFRVDALIDEASRHMPDVLDAVRKAVECGDAEAGVFRLGAAFAQAPRVSIDIGVMEKTARAAVLPIDYAWSDLGSWDAIWTASTADADGNAVSGAAVVRDSVDCLVRATEGSRVVVIGARNLAVVARGGEMLVAALDKAADLKPALAALDAVSPDRPEPAAIEPLDIAGPRLKAWLFERALPTWWCFGADHVGGGFQERLGQDLVPVRLPRRALVQARQVHAFATASLMGWAGPWLAAVDHGLDYLARRYRRPDGLCRRAVEPDGSVADDLARLYDQAFVLLALATSARAIPSRQATLEAEARGLAVAVRRTFACEGGGYRADDASMIYLADPVMHLFEAVLAWTDIADGEYWRAWAKEIADHFLTRMADADGGRIVEAFDARWEPFDGPEGRRLEPGHHFEWAWLMERWSRLTRQARPHETALALYASGERGVDARTGLVVDALLPDFTRLETTSRLWPQTERVKAALLLAPDGEPGRSTHERAAASAAGAIGAYLDTPHPGLWRDAPRGAGSAADEPAMASSFYHIIGAIEALQHPRPASGALERGLRARSLS